MPSTAFINSYHPLSNRPGDPIGFLLNTLWFLLGRLAPILVRGIYPTASKPSVARSNHSSAREITRSHELYIRNFYMY